VIDLSSVVVIPRLT